MGIIINNNMTAKCFDQGENYNSECGSVTVGSTRLTEGSAKYFINYVVGVLTSAVNIVLGGGIQYISDGPNGTYQRADLLKAVLAGRCILTTGITDLWRIIMAVFYALKAFNMQSYVLQYLNMAMPTLCACKNMVDSWANAFGSGGSAAASQLSNCSEQGASTSS